MTQQIRIRTIHQAGIIIKLMKGKARRKHSLYEKTTSE